MVANLHHQLTLAYMVIFTAAIWAATITVAAWGIGSDRLHLTLLAASVVTGFGLTAWLSIKHVKEYLLHGVDEMHGAVEEIKTNVLHFDRAYSVAIKALYSAMNDSQKNEPFDFDAAWKANGTDQRSI